MPMNYDNPKPSEVIYVFLYAIAAVAFNVVMLIVICLWSVGRCAAKLVTSPERTESEND